MQRTNLIPFQGAPIALRMAKAAINRGMDVDLQTAYALEHSYYSQVLTIIGYPNAVSPWLARRSQTADSGQSLAVKAAEQLHLIWQAHLAAVSKSLSNLYPCRSYQHRIGWRGFGLSKRSENLYSKEPEISGADDIAEWDRIKRSYHVTQVSQRINALLDVK